MLSLNPTGYTVRFFCFEITLKELKLPKTLTKKIAKCFGAVKFLLSSLVPAGMSFIVFPHSLKKRKKYGMPMFDGQNRVNVAPKDAFSWFESDR